MLKITLVPLDPLKLLELNVKQLANRPAHLPRVQTPVHIVITWNGVPGVHHKRRPQDIARMTQNTNNYSKSTRASKETE